MTSDQDRTRPIPAVVCGDLNLLRCLTGRGIPITVVASDPSEPTLRSRYVERSHLMSPATDAPHALADLMAIGEGFDDRPVLYYGTDAMLLLLARHKAELATRFRFTLPEPELCEALVDKARFNELATRTGIPIPVSFGSHEISSAHDLMAKVPLPCAFKPVTHIGWLSQRASIDHVPKKALRADTREQVLTLYDELSAGPSPFVVQHWIDGGEDSVYSFHCYADARSHVLGWFVGHKVRTYPREAGVSTYLELTRDPAVAALGFEIVSKLGLIGPLKIDVKRDAKTGKLYVLELNPRFTLWCYLGQACGVNLPEIAYADLTGQELPAPVEYRTDVRWLSFGNDLRSFLRSYRPAGELSTVDWLSSFRTKKVYDVFSWRDPAPFFASALQYGKAASLRLARTMGSRIPAVVW